MKKVIIASQNKGKISEIREILAKYGIDSVSRDDAGIPDFEIEETGETFEENSLIKAKAISDIVHLPTIADDSGLEVDALCGRPGVYSARYSGIGCSMQDNRDKLLREMKKVPEGERGARFVTVITLLYPDGSKIVARGECKGSISTAERGNNGFGYDSLFIPDGWDKTFGEVDRDVKNLVSHRGRALRKLEDLIVEVQGKGE